MQKKDSSNKKMPTSPHIQIYSWNISSLTSIMHRATGILLYISIVFISWYIAYYAQHTNNLDFSESCDCFLTKFLNIAFILAAIAIIFSLYYHFTNGIRHLFWDMGKGFEKNRAQTNGFLVIAVAKILTVITIIAAIYFNYY